MKLLLLVLYLFSPVLLFSHGRNRKSHRLAKMSEDCMYNFCENDPNYPESKVKAIIKNQTAFHPYFGGKMFAPSHTVIQSRKLNLDVKPLCKTREVLVLPLMMKDTDGINRIITNVKDYYQQALILELCDFSGGQGCYPLGHFGDYTFDCYQKFTDIKLVTVNLDHNILEHKKFQIPSGCVCKYLKL